MFKMISNVTVRFLNDSFQLDKNTCKSIELNVSMWSGGRPWDNEINSYFLPMSTSHDQEGDCCQDKCVWLIDICHTKMSNMHMQVWMVISSLSGGMHTKCARVFKQCMEPV